MNGRELLSTMNEPFSFSRFISFLFAEQTWLASDSDPWVGKGIFDTKHDAIYEEEHNLLGQCNEIIIFSTVGANRDSTTNNYIMI